MHPVIHSPGEAEGLWGRGTGEEEGGGGVSWGGKDWGVEGR